MRTSTVIFSLLELVAVSASPLVQDTYSNSEASHVLQSRQEQFYFSVTGVGGPPQMRLEIRTMEQNPDLFNLFLLGLERFQATDQNNMLSYYQVAGIHGRPYLQWDGVEPVDGGERMGYCVHSTNLFPPWHRPYLALFEQILWEHVRDIAAEYPDEQDRQRYTQLAETFRIPYWDWAALSDTGNALPDSMTRARVDVIRPSGPTTINNPLYSFYFNPYNSSLFEDRTRMYYVNFNETKRWPTNSESDAQSRNEYASRDLNASRYHQATRLYTLFWDVRDYHNFSHQSYDSRGENVETIHGGAHVSLGGWGFQTGHMTDVPFSAFDPAFWLHHTMIDRVLAMWQALNPDEYVTTEVQAQGTYAIRQGSEMGPDSPLPPFHKSANGSFWTSNDARDWKVFGYTYPELGENYTLDTLRESINILYDPRREEVNDDINESVATQEVTIEEIAVEDDDAGSSDDDRSASNGPSLIRRQNPSPASRRADYWEYKAEVQAAKFSLGGSFMVYIFCGPPPSDATTWDDSPLFVGKTVFFAAGPGAVLAPGSPDIKAKGIVPLTRHLERQAASGGIASLEPPTVEPFLHANLQWGIKKTCNTIVPASQVPGLVVKVTGVRIRPGRTASEFPSRISEETLLEDATCGKAGGFQG